MHLIESYEEEATVSIDGRTFPASCTVEDDQGIRWFVTPGTSFVPVQAWARASSLGASALLVPAVDAPVYLALTAESFMDQRSDVDLGYDAVRARWQAFEQVPSYSQVVLGESATPEPVAEAEQTGFVHLHNHFDYSLLDGMTKVKEAVQIVVEQGGWALGSADHGNCAVHPDLQEACDAAGLKPIFGMETYLVDDRFKRLEHFTLPDGLDEKSEEGRALRAAYVAGLKDYMHLVLFAVDEVGLRNLWAMSTEAYRDGLYGKNARLDWDTLARFSQGVVATSACLRGPLAHGALLEGDTTLAMERLGRLLDIYGDRFYLEIHTNQLEEQIRLNHQLVQIGREVGIPLLASVDSHYPHAEDKQTHRVMLSMNTDSDIGDDSTLFAGNQDYHLKTEAEVRDALAYLGADVVEEAVSNTARLARMCTAKVQGEVTTPIFSAKGGHEADADRLLELCLANWEKVVGKREDQDVYMARFEREFRLLVSKQFCGYFLMWSDVCRWAKANRILVGPGRGSGGGSLVAYLAGITDIDPVDADLLFERFLTEGRTSLPDFDVDFPQSRKRDVQDYVFRRFGQDNAAVVGSVLTFKSKGIVKKLSSALASTLPDDYFVTQKAISAIIDDAEGDTAGLGLSWDDLWAKAGEQLQPYRDEQPFLFEMADRLVSRVNTFGQHSAGMIIATDENLVSRLPLRRASDENDRLIVQFDKDVCERLGFVKFDFLTLRNLDTIQDTLDLIRETRGHDIDVYTWREEYLDPQVWEEIAEAHTLGIFQIETTLGTRYAQKMRPTSLADLADLVTIVRPGPRNSGLTDTYIKRRDGDEQVSYPDPRMEQFLSKTYGCLLYQEDIMQACMVLGGYDSNEADEVRKILGKKKVEKVAAAGQEFVTRAVERGMNPAVATALWSQMAEFAKYSFNRAHAYAYAVLAYWCAWLKFHYPVEYLTSALSSVDKDRIPEFVKEARRMGYAVQVPDINESGVGFTAGVLSVRYGLSSIKGIGSAAESIVANRPYTSFDDFMTRVVEPTGSKVNRGHVALLAKIGAFDTLVPNRRGLEQVLLADKTGVSTRCVHKTNDPATFVWTSIQVRKDDAGNRYEEQVPVSLPCSFDWDSEPAPINPRTEKKMKRKPPVKRCTTGCRNYAAPPPMQIEDAEPYTEADIRDIEQELLGVFLTSTPFDMLPPDWRETTRGQAELLTSLRPPDGVYLTAGVLTKTRPHKSRDGREMGFLGFETEHGNVDVTAFNEKWIKHKPDLKVGTFYVFEVDRNSRGCTLYSLMPYSPSQEN